MHMKKGIRARMARTVMAVALLSIFVLGIAAASGLFRMRTQTLKINQDMGAQAAQDSRAILEQEAMDQLSALAQAKAETVDANIQTIMSQVDVLASAAEKLYAAPASFGRVPVLPPDAANQGVFTSQIVYAERTPPADVADEVGLIGNLTAQMNGVSEFLKGAGTTQIGTESGFIVMCDENSHLKTSMGYLDPTERSWYRMAADGGELVWSEVFEDTYGRGLAVTCGKPVYGPDGELKAVISIGSTLDDIGTSVTGLTIGETGYAFVVDRSGQAIMSKDLSIDGEGHVTGTWNLSEGGGGGLRMELIMQDIANRKSGVTQTYFHGQTVYMAYEPMEHMPWTVVTVMTVHEVQAPAQEGAARISALSTDAGRQISEIIRSTGLLIAAAAVLAITVAIVFGLAAAKRITTPLSHLTSQVEQLTGGDLNTRIDLQTGDELQTLAEAFNSMTARLEKYIRDLTAVTAEKERIGAELNVATQIQKDMLPNIFPAFPDQKEIDIYAAMDPAKEVGGDFYDFFKVDSTHLGVVMADVSGKGVPAALFMVIAKTIIKNQALTGGPLEQVFARANEQLCENNGEGLFVTAFMGLLDLTDGTFAYVNAGHNPPLLRHSGGPYEYLQLSPGFVLAGLEGMEFPGGTLQLAPGDALFLYTDGVTEALNTEEELFGEDRLKAALNAPEAQGKKPIDLLPHIRSVLSDFAQGAEQADDITMLAITYIGPEKEAPAMRTLTVPAETDQLETVQAFIDVDLDEADCPLETRIQIQIAVEEIFVNIANYAYGDAQGEAVIGCFLEKDPLRITVRFQDRGTPFDPLAKEDADITLSAEERDIGGLGIYMVKNSMDNVTYAREDGCNILTIQKDL